MNINDLFPSKYLKSGDIGDTDMVLTITSVSTENVGTGESQEIKPILHFEEIEKGFVLNKTNANTIAGLYGPNTDDWTGKKIALFAQEVDFQGKQVLALRVRMKAPAAQKQESGKRSESWQPALVSPIIKAGLAENVAEAVRMLNYSNLPNAKDTPVETVVAWARLYRGWREMDLEPAQAAEFANSGEPLPA